MAQKPRPVQNDVIEVAIMPARHGVPPRKFRTGTGVVWTAKQVHDKVSGQHGAGALISSDGYDVDGESEEELPGGLYTFHVYKKVCEDTGRERLKLIGDLTQQTLSRGQKAAIVMEQLKAHLGGKGAERDVAEDREREAALRACNKHDPDLVQAVGVHFPILQRDDELDAIVAHMGMIQAMGRDPDARSSTEYHRKPHLQLVLGGPGIGKTTLLERFAELVLERLRRDSNWLSHHNGFRECLESCLGADTPHVFTLDLLNDVNTAFSSALVAELCGTERRMLALLMLLAVCRRVKPSIDSLDSLVDFMPDSLLAYIQPADVILYIHRELPRRNPATDSFSAFAFDEAAGLDPEPLRRLRSALVYVKKTKRMLPLGANFTVLSASTRGGPTEASEESKAASQDQQANVESADASSLMAVADKDWVPSAMDPQLTPSGQTAVQIVSLRLLSPQNKEKLMHQVLAKLGISLDGRGLPAYVKLLLKYVPGIPRQVAFVMAAMALSDTPHAFSLKRLQEALRFQTDSPARIHEVYYRLQKFVKVDTLEKGPASRLNTRPEFAPVCQAAALRALCGVPVGEHDLILPRSKWCGLSYSHLQGHGFLTLQPVRGSSGLFRVVMSPATLDALLRSVCGRDLAHIYSRQRLAVGSVATMHFKAKEIFDLESVLLVLGTGAALQLVEAEADLERDKGASWETTLRTLLCLPSAVKGRAFDAPLNLPALRDSLQNFAVRELHNRPVPSEIEDWLETGELTFRDQDGAKQTIRVDAFRGCPGDPRPDWSLRLKTLDPTLPVIHLQGQSKQVQAAARAPPPDGGLKLIKVEYEKMWTHEDNSAMLLVTDQLLTAVHNFPNLAVLCSPESSLDEEPAHNLYHPVVRTSRLLDDMAQAGMTVYVDISDVKKRLLEQLKRRQEKKRRLEESKLAQQEEAKTLAGKRKGREGGEQQKGAKRKKGAKPRKGAK